MRPIYKMNVIQIEVTNACAHQCANCTRFCGHHKVPFFMDMQTFKKSLDSMKGFEGMIGIMGGEPTLHPDFKEMSEVFASQWHPEICVSPKYDPIESFQEYIAENELQNWSSKRGLWSSLGKKYYDNFEVIQDCYDFQLINDHSHSGVHQSLLISRKELGISDEEWIPIRDNCWVQNSWSASITPKGAFFCEVAAALDMLFDGPGGWDIEPGWWKREPKYFGSQLDWCEICSACLNVPKMPANEELDLVSPVIAEKLRSAKSRKLANGKVKVLSVDDLTSVAECDYTSEWYLPDGDNFKRIAPTNKSLLPKQIDVYDQNEFKSIIQNLKELVDKKLLTDWIIITDSKYSITDEFLNNLFGWIFNPGCLYVLNKLGNTIMFNINAYSLLNRSYEFNSELENKEPADLLMNIWEGSKIIYVDNLKKDPATIAAKLRARSAAEKQKTFEMTAHNLNIWRSLVERNKKIALYGAGQHSKWLIELLADSNLILPSILVDDSPHQDNLLNIPVTASSDFDTSLYDVIVISSDIHHKKMMKNAREMWIGKIEIIDPYENMEDAVFQK